MAKPSTGLEIGVDMSRCVSLLNEIADLWEKVLHKPDGCMETLIRMRTTQNWAENTKMINGRMMVLPPANVIALRDTLKRAHRRQVKIREE
jgi:hypothetical protein